MYGSSGAGAGGVASAILHIFFVAHNSKNYYL